MKQSTNPLRRLGLGALLLMASLLTTTTLFAEVIVDKSHIQFGATFVGDSKEKTFTVTNDGDTTATVTVATAAGPYAVTDYTGAVTLEAGASETFTIRYAPTVGDIPPLTDMGMVTVSYTTSGDSAKTGSSTIRLRGFAKRDRSGGTNTGGNDSVNISVNEINFGAINEGESITRTFTITTFGEDSTMITVGSLDAPFAVETGGGTFTLDGGVSRTVRLRFAPMSEGMYDDTLMILARSGIGGTDTIHLRVKGTALNVSQQMISINPGSIQFTGVTTGDSEQRAIVIRNTDSTVMLTGMVDTVGLPFRITSGGGAFTLQPGQTHIVTVAFEPTMPGTYLDSVVIHYMPAGGSQITQVVPLTGIAVAANSGNGGDPLVTTTTSIDFGNVIQNSSATRTLFLRNTDSTNAIMVGGNVGGVDQPFQIVQGAGPFLIAPGETLPITVRFTPTTLGLFMDSVVIDYSTIVNGLPVDTARKYIGLSGRGGSSGSINSPIAFSDVQIVFNGGSGILVGDAIVDTLILTNNGSTSTTVGILAPNAPFAIVGGSNGGVIQPGQSLPVIIRFEPMAEGIYNGFVRFVYGPSTNLSTQDILLRGIATVESSVTAGDEAIGMMLGGSTPNPASDRTTIDYALNRNGHVTIAIYNGRGERVATLIDEAVAAGRHTVDVDAASLQSGVYYVTMTADGGTLTRTMTVIR